LALRNHYGTTEMHAEARTSPTSNVYISDLQPALNIKMLQVYYWTALNSTYSYCSSLSWMCYRLLIIIGMTLISRDVERNSG